MNPLNIEYALASPSLRVPRPMVNMATMALTITNTAPNSTLRGTGDGASGQRRPTTPRKKPNYRSMARAKLQERPRHSPYRPVPRHAPRGERRQRALLRPHRGVNHGLGHPARELQKPDRAQLPRREPGAVDPRGQGHVDRRAGSVAAGSRVQGADEDGIAGFQRRDLRVVLRMRRGRVGAVSSVVGTSGEEGRHPCLQRGAAEEGPRDGEAPRRTSLARPAGSIPAAFAASALSSPTKHLSGTSRIADHPIRSDRSVTLIA